MVFLVIIGLIGLAVAIVLAIVAVFKLVGWKTVGWTAGASLVAIVVGAAFGGGSSTAPTGGTPAPSGSSAPASNPAPAPPSNSAPAPATPPAPAPKPEKPKPELEVVEVHQEGDGYVQYAAGTVKNNSNRKYGYVQVEINLYDGDGNQVGSTLANANNLEPGATWKFRAPVFEDNVKQFKVVDITGF
ncbi:FxLYD domain-containing protein [Kyrpidia sp.]|uniref:FxLYD domain-containing protein n=1 Tax=Kyrpidia sp. TaxID=2073077 RepID=UPI0025844D8A|nr:FxLYD domain-containing protein [Kyrpidia sp.]MCL6575147.1 FxLYD domain-containing protein [Kyrpidia sp.]